MPTYTAKVVEDLVPDPGTWPRIRVGVFRVVGDREEQVGEYVRNYSLQNTFFPFTVGEKAFALYSPHYTVTRVMVLQSCRDVGGEEPSAGGFCPVEYFVPGYVIRESADLEGKLSRYRYNNPKPEDLLPQTFTYHSRDKETGEVIPVEKPSYPVTPFTYYDFGFVAGCIWGDDSSWKIEHLDLSQVEKGIIRRTPRFGYIELPDNLTLHDAIDMTDYLYDDKCSTITIAVQKHLDLKTGREPDPPDSDA